MGFLDDYEVDLDDFNESGFDIPDGTYEFEVVGGELKRGTKADEDAVHIVINFNFVNEDGETHQFNWWLKVPDNPDRPTRRESISMSDWKKWILGAGFPATEVNKIGPDDIEGITGTVRMVTGKPNKSGTAYQNPKDWTFDEAEEEEEKPKKAAPKKAAAKVAPKKAKPAPEPEEEEEEDDEEEEETPTPRKSKANPFKK